MSIRLQEYVVGFDPKNPVNAIAPDRVKLQEGEQALTMETAEFVTAIEAMHAGVITRNFTCYMEDSFRPAVDSWTAPYNIPVIMFHNDFDGEVVGRVLKAEATRSTKTNGSTMLVHASIPGYQEQQKIRDGILHTVSVGADGTDVRCSICGKQLGDGDWCEHTRGNLYDGKLCYWEVHAWTAKELSFVIVPADPYAGVISFKSAWEDCGESGENCERGPRPKHLCSNGAKTDVNIQDHEQKPSEKETNTLELKEAEQKIASLETANKALTGDKVSLQESIDSLNKDKIALQESITGLKKELEETKLGVAHEKELREAAEGKIEEMSKEVKLSLAESLASLREKAGKPALEKLEERSIDSLRDSIADLKAELKESEQKKTDDKNAEEMKDAKGAAQNVSLQEREQKPGDNNEAAPEEAADEDFGL